MKAKVISPYTDIETGDVHMAGETVELTDERFAAIAERGYVEKASAPARKPAARKATTRKPPSGK